MKAIDRRQDSLQNLTAMVALWTCAVIGVFGLGLLLCVADYLMAGR